MSTTDAQELRRLMVDMFRAKLEAESLLVERIAAQARADELALKIDAIITANTEIDRK